MSFSFSTNIASLQAQNHLNNTSDFQTKTIGRVTSGLRITTAGDDSTGLAIANGYRLDQAVLTQGIRNANDGLSTLQTVDGGLNNVSQLLDRARTLATQSASGTFTGDRDVLNSEFQSLMTEIDRQAQSIGLNRDGTFAKALSVFIGGGKTTGSTTAISNGSVSVDLSASTVDTYSLGLNSYRATNTGYNLGDDTVTSVTSILSNATNMASQPATGTVRFLFTGAGFSGSGEIAVDVNVAGVTDTESLMNAIDTAIEAAANPATPTTATTAFKNAGITATIVTDSAGREQLAFDAANAAFQVKAGDRTANALMGNFEGVDSTGTTINTYFTGDSLAGSAAGGAEALLINGRLLSLGTIAVNASFQDRVDAFNTAIAATTDTSLKDSFTACLEGNKIRIENVNGDSFTLAATAATQADYGLSGSSSASTYALTAGTAMSVQTHSYGPVTGSGSVTPANNTFSFTFVQGGTTRNVNVALDGTEADADAVATKVQNAVNLAGYTEFTVDDDGGTHLVVTATSAGTAFTVTAGDLASETALGISSAGQTAVDTPGGGAAVAGTAVVTIGDSLGSHALSVPVSLNDDTGTLVAALQAQIDADTGTGGTAGRYIVSQDASHYLIVSATDTAAAFTVDADATAQADLGLPATGSALPTALATSSVFTSTQANSADSGGAQISSRYGDTAAYSWTALASGETQTLTFSGFHADGAQYSWSTDLTDATTTGLDTALSTINDALQASGDTSLQKIVAVKDADSNGVLGVRFMSTEVFSVQLGTSSVAAGGGLSDKSSGAPSSGQGAILLSVESEGGGVTEISTQVMAQDAVNALAGAVTILGNAQATVGKGQNTFSFAVNLAQSQTTNLASAESRIRDADLATEAANLTKAQILVQAGTAALAQANSTPQAILALLKG